MESAVQMLLSVPFNRDLLKSLYISDLKSERGMQQFPTRKKDLAMSGSSCLRFAGFLCFISLTCLAIATGSNFWYVVKPNEASNSTKGAYLYPYHAGIFMTCYTKNIPDTVNKSELINGHCVKNYDFSSNKIEEFARTSTVSIVLSCAMTSWAGIIGLVGCLRRKKTPLILGALFLLTSCIITIVGIYTYETRVELELKARDIPLPENVTAEFGWSFRLTGTALFFQLLASLVLFVGAKIYDGSVVYDGACCRAFISCIQHLAEQRASE